MLITALNSLYNDG